MIPFTDIPLHTPSAIFGVFLAVILYSLANITVAEISKAWRTRKQVKLTARRMDRDAALFEALDALDDSTSLDEAKEQIRSLQRLQKP